MQGKIQTDLSGKSGKGVHGAVVAFMLLVFNGCIFAQDSLSDPAQNLVISILHKVEQENRITGNISPDSLSSLPVGIMKEIGNTRYIIAIDSAKFLPDGAFFNAYMAIEFPGSGKRLAFAARNIKFNPSGVVGGNQARLVLVSDHTITLTPDLKLHIPADGNNFIEWDCNGFKGIGLKGEFLFSKGLLIPDSTQTWDRQVKATFQCYATDINNILVSANITPFCVKGLRGWSFVVTNASVDMSSVANAPGMTFPVAYPEQTLLWQGFFLKEFRVKLPPEMPGNGERTTISARNLIIDHTGLTGMFIASDIFSFGEGNMNGWEFSLDELSLHFLCNKVSGGGMKGKLRVPLMDSGQALLYTANISYDPLRNETDYLFAISPKENVDFKIFRAKVDLYPSSSITVIRDNGVLKPKAVLNGRITFNDQKVNTPKLDFQQLTLITEAPYLVNGIFALSGSGSSRAANYPVSISSIGIVVNPNTPKIKLDLAFNLMQDASQSISATTRLFLEGKIEKEYVSSLGEFPKPIEKTKWKFERVQIGGIALEVNTAPFYLKGIASFRENDPDYGNGFFGTLKFMVRDVMKDTAVTTACFGHTTFRYWYVDAFVPVSIPLGPAPSSITITRIIGGLYHHMKPQRNEPGPCIAALTQNFTGQSSTQRYYPDELVAVGFKAGCSFKYSPSEKAANGDVMLELMFNTSGGLSRVSLDGNIYMMASITERTLKPAPVKGTASILFDPPNRIFDATFSVTMVAANVMSAHGYAKIHIDPQTWYFAAGRPTQPASVNIINVASGSAYFMIGNTLEPMAPVPSQVSALVSSAGLNAMRDNNALASGSGFCGGIRFASSFYKEFGKDFFTVYGGFAYGVGFDMMLLNYGPNAHCVNSSAPAGLNGWVASGQLYIYLQGSIGVKGHIEPDWCHSNWCQGDFDITILSGSIAALVSGKAPNPSWLQGEVACTYSILGIVNGSFSFSFEAGYNCTITGS